MKDALSGLGHAIRDRRWLFAGTLTGFVLVYHAGLMLAMLVRFGNIPNYVTFYNWPGNVWRILESTPSLSDSLAIIADEWLIEVGYMTYEYGNGISEWALTVVPTKLFVILIVAAAVASLAVLLLPPRHAACPTDTPRAGSIATATGGAALVGLSSATLSWVVCCATPTWVVSLAMMGMSASLALWLEPFGDALTIGGFVLLLFPLWKLSRRRIRNGYADGAPFATMAG